MGWRWPGTGERGMENQRLLSGGSAWEHEKELEMNCVIQSQQ